MNPTFHLNSQREVVGVDTPSEASAQFELFDRSSNPQLPATGKSGAARAFMARWHEFDDAVADMNSLCLSDRMRRLAISPLLLEELAFTREGWRWPTSLDSVDLLRHQPPPEPDAELAC